jgi:hypothetical protein
MKAGFKDTDKGYNNLVKFFKQNPASVEIGIFENKIGKDGQSIAEYAAVNEFGAVIKSMKARTWLRHAMNRAGMAIVKQSEQGYFEKGITGVSMGYVRPSYSSFDPTAPIKIPERSFMRSSYDANIERITQKLNKLVAKGLLTGGNIKNILKICGEDMRNVIVMKIRTANQWAKPLHPFTVAMKGHDTILINSGNMWKAIDIRSK